jgi:hypothetical protein
MRLLFMTMLASLGTTILGVLCPGDCRWLAARKTTPTQLLAAVRNV